MNTIGALTRSERANPALEAGIVSRFCAAAAYVGTRWAVGLSDMLERRRSRRVLLGLTDDQLKDIGLSRADAEREGLRNAWE